MYKLFAFSFFIVITLVIGAMYLPAGNIIRDKSLGIFLLAVLVYFSFIVYVIFSRLFIARDKVNQYSGKLVWLSQGIFSKVVNLVFLVIIVGIALIVTLAIAAGGFQWFIQSYPDAFRPKYEEEQIINIREDIRLLSEKLRQDKMNDFLRQNKSTYKAEDKLNEYKLVWNNFSPKGGSFENVYSYGFEFCSKNKDNQCKKPIGLENLFSFDQGELIKSFSVISHPVFDLKNKAIFVVYVTTDEGVKSALIYPSINSGESLEYKILENLDSIHLGNEKRLYEVSGPFRFDSNPPREIITVHATGTFMKEKYFSLVNKGESIISEEN